MGYNPNRFVLVDKFVVEMLVLGCFGIITTSRWFVCRICGCSQKTIYRWSTFWPLIMLLPWPHFILSSKWPNLPHEYTVRAYFALAIAGAFGLAFSIVNMRIPSWYSRGLGLVCSLLHGYLLYILFSDCQEYASWQTP